MVFLACEVMEDRRRNYNYNNNYNNNKSFTRSQYRKPPQPPPPGPDYYKPDVPAWVHSVPSWERRFITTVGKMPWGRFVYCQKSLDLYNDIFQWDDSAGGEAFHNAKNRFWAEMHGHPCEICSPDPDVYIDNIDWNAWSDPELYKDLDKVPVITDEENNTKGEFVDTAAPSYGAEPIVATGWGDDEPNLESSNVKANNKDSAWTTQNEWEDVPWVASCLKSLMKPIIPPECVDRVDDPGYPSCYPSLQHGDSKIIINNNKWEDNCGGWENVHHSSQNDDKKTNDNPWEKKSGGWEGTPWGSQDSNRKSKDTNNSWERNFGGWEAAPWGLNNPTKNTADTGNLGHHRNSGNWRTGNENWRKRESEGHQLSRYKTTRNQGDDYQQDHGWRNNRGKKRVSFAHENSPVEQMAPRQWNSPHTCGPSHHNPGEAENSWGWQKQVSHHIN